MELDEDGTTVLGEEQLFNNWWGRLRDICVDPQGAIYLATNGPNWSNTEPFTHSIVKVWNPEYVSVAEQGMNQNHSIKIFPNPANSMVNISSDFHPGQLNMKIISLDGKLITEQLLNEGGNQIPVHDLPPGMYFVTIDDQGEVIQSEKLFIAR
jgi:hypothetical protein